MPDIEALKARSQWLRQELLRLVVGARKGNIPTAFSIVETVVALYYGGFMRIDPANPDWPDRDRLVISKGHAAMALYPILADLGYLPKSELERYAKTGGMLRLYPDTTIPGIEAALASLGHGLGISAGLAWAAKKDGRPSRHFVILGDGENYEGSVWEAALFCAHHRLNNLVAIVDRNRQCILGETEKCIRLEPIPAKWEAFGWHAIEIDGHSYTQIFAALDQALDPARTGPTVIISNTVKGKGISFMENVASWHFRMVNAEQAERARQDLEANCILN